MLQENDVWVRICIERIKEPYKSILVSMYKIFVFV